MRRGVAAGPPAGRDAIRFPVIRIPWDRDNPWQAVFLHEVAHNLQADLGLWHENRDAVDQPLVGSVRDRWSSTIFRRWHKEIFADLAAVLLGGPVAALGHGGVPRPPAPRALTYRPGGAHPTGYLRGSDPGRDAAAHGFRGRRRQCAEVWRDLYDPRRGHRLPAPLLRLSPARCPAVVDEIAFQTRRGLGQRALADIIPFTPRGSRPRSAAARCSSPPAACRPTCRRASWSARAHSR